MLVLTFEVALLQSFLRCRVMRKIGAIFRKRHARLRCVVPSASRGVWYPLGPLSELIITPRRTGRRNVRG